MVAGVVTLGTAVFPIVTVAPQAIAVATSVLVSVIEFFSSRNTDFIQ